MNATQAPETFATDATAAPDAPTCPQGHVFDEENTYVSKGGRKCRTCHREREQVRRERARAAKIASQPPLSLEQIAWSKVEVRGSNDCWPWLGSLLQSGHGRLRHKGTTHKAHRLIYELAVGPISQGLHIDHVCHGLDQSCAGGSECKHRRCCNPAHLEPVTPAENVLRGRSPAAQNSRKTHCSQGHELTAENVQIMKGGGRRCRLCAGLTGSMPKRDAAPLRTHCPNGHAYTEANTYSSPRGKRSCRECMRAAAARRRKKGSDV